MFKKLASDALGLSDIGKIISPEDFDKVAVDDYILNEDQEKIYFVIKSKQDEYCFTNFAFIHLDGESAVSKKRVLSRYDYLHNAIDNVQLETAGTIDLDVEIKFSIGEDHFTIDVDRNQIELLKDLYKSLIAIALIQEDNRHQFDYAIEAQSLAAGVLARGNMNQTAQAFDAVRESAMTFFTDSHNRYKQANFGNVFEKYLNN